MLPFTIMSTSIPLPPPYVPHSRPTSVPPVPTELTRDVSPSRSLPSPISRASSPFSLAPDLARHRFLCRSPYSRRTSSTDTFPPSSVIGGRRASDPVRVTQLAHQLAAETLLTMAPSTSRSPESRSEKVSVPAPAPAVRTSADQPEESRGIKRKNGEEDSKPSSAGLGLVGVDKERDLVKERAYSHSPLALHEARPPPAATAHASPFVRQANEAPLRAQHSAASRYSIYGPTVRDGSPMLPLDRTPWAVFNQRYNSLGPRRDISPAVSNGAPKPATLESANRPSPDIHRDARLLPNASTPSQSTSMSGYGHYSMGRRELAEHREQLREGKRWLEVMLAKTEKMLHMVENKMALTGEMGSTAAPDVTTSVGNGNVAPVVSASPASTGLRITNEPTHEEREKTRQKEIQRLEDQRERDRVEGGKREREEVRDRAQDRAGERASSLSGLTRGDRGEAERNRDLLLASRKVTAVSPNGRERSTVTPAVTEGAGTGTATGRGSWSAMIAGPAGGAGPGVKPSPWAGDPVMAGVALPKREQTGLSRQLGRGLWSFDFSKA